MPPRSVSRGRDLSRSFSRSVDSRSSSRSPSRPRRSPSRPRRSISPRRSASPRRNGGDIQSRSISRSPSPALKSTKIVIEKLSKTMNEEHLREIFTEFGPIKDMELPISRQSNINRGMAYIQYTEVADAEAAIAHMHEATLDGNIISVSIVIPRRKFSSPPPVGRRGSYFPSRDSPPYRGPPAGRRRSPPRGYGRGRGGGHMDTYRPHLGPRSRSPRRHRSLSKSRSRSPVPRRGGRRETLERGGARRRSLSYSSYSSENGRSRSRGPDDGGRR